MDALALPAEQGQVLHSLGAGVAEPMGDAGVEFGRFPAAQDEVVLTKDQPESTAQHVEPFVALVSLEIRLLSCRSGRQDHLEGLERAGLLSQRDNGHAVQRTRFEVHAGVTSRRGTDELVKGDPMCLGERQEQFKAWPPLPRLEPGQRADRYAGGFGEAGEGHLSLLPEGS